MEIRPTTQEVQVARSGGTGGASAPATSQGGVAEPCDGFARGPRATVAATLPSAATVAAAVASPSTPAPPPLAGAVLSGDFSRWEAGQLLGTDPAGNCVKLGDGADGARDIVAAYASEGAPDQPYCFRVDLADLPAGAEYGRADLYLLVDFREGGREDLPDGIKGRTAKPWEVALGIYDREHATVLSADGRTHQGMVRGIAFDPGHKAVQYALDKQVLRSMGWQDGQALSLQFFTAKDFRPEVTDVATKKKPWENGGLIEEAFITPGTTPAPAPTPPGPPPPPPAGQPKIYVAFHWHMHQPIYYPGENIIETSQNPKSSFNPIPHVTWPDRQGGYTHYLADAVEGNANLPHMGAQVSWTGSLTEDVDTLAKAGQGFPRDWNQKYREARQWRTAQGNPRLDFVGIGYHHPLMALTTTGKPGEDRDMDLQVKMQQNMIEKTFGGPPSRGYFPPEDAFTERVIPVLKGAGYDWALVDNFHMDRANRDFPWSPAQKVEPPNRADAVNPPQGEYAQIHCEQNTTNPVSRTGLVPHYVRHVNPDTGQETRMIAVPSERSLGYDDSYGDRSPVSRLAQLEKFNTDPKHPLLIVMAHDGDNFGCSGSRYYLDTMRWVQQNPDRVEATTIQDYLDRFPPDKDDVIHVEDGSWTGADLGNPEFGKWLGKPYNPAGKVDHEKGYSPDRNSWAVLVAAENRIMTADRIKPPVGPDAIQAGTGNDTDQAWHHFLQGETSCYEYWDGQAEWDDKPTIAANNAMKFADRVIGAGENDTVGPTLFVPQRYPYNPGGKDDENPAAPAPRDFTVWTMGYDVNGIKSIELKWRVDPAGPGAAPEARKAGEVYAGEWNSLPMKERELPSRGAVAPQYKASEYSAEVAGQKECLVDYFIEAVDGKGNVTRSPIQKVYVE